MKNIIQESLNLTDYKPLVCLQTNRSEQTFIFNNQEQFEDFNWENFKQGDNVYINGDKGNETYIFNRMGANLVFLNVSSLYQIK